MAEPEFDRLKDKVGVATQTVATVTSYAGMIAPGPIGNVLEAASVGLSTAAEEDQIVCDAAGLLRRLHRADPSRYNSVEELSEVSVLLQGDQNYTSSKYGSRYAGLGVRIGGAALGGLVGGVIGSIIPGPGTLIGATLGSIGMGVASDKVTSFIFPERAMSNTQVCLEGVNAQDEGTYVGDHTMMALGRRCSPSDQDYIEKQVKAGNMIGMGMDDLVMQHFGPLLGEDFYARQGDITAIEYLTDKIRNRELDAAQLYLNTDAMRRVPPPPLQAQQLMGSNVEADENIDAGLPPMGMPMRGRGGPSMV